MKKFYGQSIVGEWSNSENQETWFPNSLKENEGRFEWKVNTLVSNNYLWPHLNGKALIYDESE